MSDEDNKPTKNKKLAKEAQVSLAAYIKVVWVSKVLMAIAIIAVILMFVSVGYTISLFPLKEIETKYVEFSTSDNNFVTIATANEDIQSNDNLISLMLKKYVLDREKVNHIDETERYKYVYALSNNDVSARFKLFYGGEKALVHKEHIVRDIVLGPITRIAKKIIIIDFETVDTNYNEKKRNGKNYKPSKRQWQATIKYAFSSQKVKEEEKELNPIGIFVSRYQASERRY